MSLTKQLSRWQTAGLIDSETRERIEAFEARRSRPRGVHAMAALGGISVGIGVVSIVAANWDGIGGHTKLAVDALLGVALAVGMYHAVRAKFLLLAEVLGLLYYLFSLASLALVGQVYQLNTPVWQVLALWSLVTLPLVLLLRTPLSGSVWFVGLCTSYMMSVTDGVDLFRLSRLRNDLTVTLVAAFPLVVMLAARMPWLLERRQRFVRAVDSGAWSAVVLAGLLSPFAFYTKVREQDTLGIGLWGCAGAVLALHFCQQRWLEESPRRARLGVSLLLASTWLSFSLGVAFAHGDLDLVGALLQLCHLGLLAYTSLQFGWVRGFHVVTGVVALRILVIYFEVFGSMLSTGLGLVGGGVLTLLLAWVWKRKSPDLAARLEGDPEASHAA